MWDGVLCNNYAKCKEEEGVSKSRTGVSVPRPPAAKRCFPITKVCSHMEDVARRPSSYLKILFLVAGGRGTEATVLLWFPYFNNDAKNNEAEYLKVGPGSPCPVLQQPKYIFQYPNYVSTWRTWHGDHRPTKICCFVIITPNVKRRRGYLKVGPGSPCPVL